MSCLVDFSTLYLARDILVRCSRSAIRGKSRKMGEHRGHGGKLGDVRAIRWRNMFSSCNCSKVLIAAFSNKQLQDNILHNFNACALVLPIHVQRLSRHYLARFKSNKSLRRTYHKSSRSRQTMPTWGKAMPTWGKQCLGDKPASLELKRGMDQHLMYGEGSTSRRQHLGMPYG